MQYAPEWNTGDLMKSPNYNRMFTLNKKRKWNNRPLSFGSSFVAPKCPFWIIFRVLFRFILLFFHSEFNHRAFTRTENVLCMQWFVITSTVSWKVIIIVYSALCEIPKAPLLIRHSVFSSHNHYLSHSLIRSLSLAFFRQRIFHIWCFSKGKQL